MSGNTRSIVLVDDTVLSSKRHPHDFVQRVHEIVDEGCSFGHPIVRSIEFGPVMYEHATTETLQHAMCEITFATPACLQNFSVMLLRQGFVLHAIYVVCALNINLCITRFLICVVFFDVSFLRKMASALP